MSSPSAGGALDAFDIVVPVRNEEASIDAFCERMAQLGYLEALLFVDNASTDETLARLQRYPQVRVLRHAADQGYGASIRDGIAASNAARIVIIDADLEYPPESIPSILAALEQHPIVYGSRFLGPRPPAMPLLRRLGNRLISGVYNRLFHQHTTDLYTGMKGLRRDALPLAELRRDGFEHVLELGVMVSAAGLTIHEVPVQYTPRTRGRSKMRHLPETLKFAALLLRYRLRDFFGGSGVAR